MLLELNIQNYALIDHLKIDFSDGFTVITGETGAGKSIILGGLSLILGERADFKVLRDKEKKCIVEGVFDVSGNNLKSFFIDHDLDYEEHTIIRREIIPSGKSRAFVNDTPVTLHDLKLLLSKLIDLHTQHATLTVSERAFQIRTLDSKAGTLEECKTYNRQYVIYKDLLKELEDKREQLANANQQSDYLLFQLNELNEAKIVDGELEDLELEWKKMSHSEELKANLYKAYELMSGQEQAANELIMRAAEAMQDAANIDESLKEHAERIQSLHIELSDLSQTIETHKDDISFDPQRLEVLQDRLNLINRLLQKHNVSSEKDLIDIAYQMQGQAGNTEFLEEEINRLEHEISAQKERLTQLGEELNASRKRASESMIQEITEKLQLLGIPDAGFDIQWQPAVEPAKDAIDTMQFLFSANKGNALQPLEKVASGGELSRIVLSLKSMIANAVSLPTLIFDEIDTGVSGEVADKTAQMLKQIASGTQVIAITHLPQMAGKGNDHLKVLKESTDSQTVTRLVRLNQEERVEEIAKMLSGEELTEEAMSNAKVLLTT